MHDVMYGTVSPNVERIVRPANGIGGIVYSLPVVPINNSCQFRVPILTAQLRTLQPVQINI